MSYRIGELLIDPQAYEIRHGGALVPVEPQVFDLLILLIENRERAVSKDEIIQRIWNGRIVSDAALSSRIKTARQALGDDGSAQRLIRTIHGRGFRFVGEVEEIDRPTAGSSKQNVGALTEHERVPVPGVNEPTVVTPPIGPGLTGRLTVLPKWATVAAACIVLILTGYAVNRLLTRSAGPRGDSQLKHTTPSGSIARTREAATAFKDCDVCPEMVELPSGEFMMGSPEDERGREQFEGPQRRVIIAKRFALGVLEVTVDQFETFVAETGMTVGSTCHKVDTNTARWSVTESSFRQPGFNITGSHPAVCVSWHEAQAYAAWLGRRTGKPYRLPSEAEWEYAARAGTTTRYSFGSDESELCRHARFADLGSRFRWRGACRSGETTFGPSHVGRLKPNPWGLFDMHGNAWEWVADCWAADPGGLPTDGSALVRPGICEVGVVRGGSWATEHRKLRSAQRVPMGVADRRHHIGFRVALTRAPP
jgi:formylglycine-generating enzyme required for sulfatase activity/DNA-binding winged helix-turn-helix (wHTH) protein